MTVGVDSVLAGRYELGARLGRGGMAEVFAAHDRRLDRPVAIKVFNPAVWSDTDGRVRFDAEARLAASVAHPNVVVIHDVGIEDDVPYLVMERLPGATLADEIRRGRLPIARVEVILDEMLQALGSAHARGVLHRDLKPANVLIASDGRSKLTDFGIATSETLTGLTAAGLVIGTPAYLAPERLGGARATVRSDLYALGVMGYEALAGVRPFNADSPIALASMVQHSDPAPLRSHRNDVPGELEAVVMRAIARRPDDRFANADEFATALKGARRRTGANTTETVRVVPMTATQVLPPPTIATPRRRARRSWAVAAAAILYLTIAAFAINRFQTTPSTPHPSTPTNPRTITTLPAALRGPFDSLQQAVQP